MDEVPQVTQVPAQVPAQVPEVLEKKPVPRTFNFRKFLDTGSWIALFALTPLFFLAYLSQNSVPGDILYPVKRGIENTILAAASVNPASKAAFHTNLVDRRFTEAEKLLLSQADIAPLNDLVAQIESTQVAIDNVSDPVKQQELTAKVIAQIDTYQAKLTSTAAQVQNSPSPFSVAPTSVPTGNTVTTVPASVPSTPTPTPTSTPSTSVPVSALPTQAIPAPVTAGATPQITAQKVQVEHAIEITKFKLEKVKKELEEKSRQREEKREGKENRRESLKENINSSRED